MFRKLLTFDEAKKVIEDYFKPVFLGEEDAVLLEAYNRVLNEDVVSTLPATHSILPKRLLK